ncbi:very low-density lipoprotein receptor-like [Mytilus edulis]|uniref:very low-density lipoprotein receptor-like n=1 Tax=Mytilus edulis TaxID=6550 RepID=UPI0039EFA7F0
MDIIIWLLMCLLPRCVPQSSPCLGKLLYSNSISIIKFDVETRNSTVLVKQVQSIVYALDYDYTNRYVYLPRFDQFDIVRFPYPSTNIKLKIIIATDPHPTGIAVDSVNEHIYWVTYGALSRSNLDGTNEKTVSTSLSVPWVIRLDFTNRWSYIVEENVGILKSRFDVYERKTIVKFISTPVRCMTIDTDENRLYWISNDSIMTSVKDDGSDVKTILSTHVTRRYYAIGVFGRYIYYHNYNQLLMVNKVPGSTPTRLYNDTSEITSLFVFKQSGQT